MSTAFAASRRASSATAKRPAMPDAAAGAGAGAGVGTKAAGAAPAQPKKRVALGNISNVPAAGGRAAAVAGHGKEVPPPPPGTAVRTVRPSNRRGDRSFVRLRAGIGGGFRVSHRASPRAPTRFFLVGSARYCSERFVDSSANRRGFLATFSRLHFQLLGMFFFLIHY
jgi:hypothetical protein